MAGECECRGKGGGNLPNIITSHNVPENFIEILQVVQKSRKISLSVLAIFIDLHQFFGFFDISKKLMTSLITNTVIIFSLSIYFR